MADIVPAPVIVPSGIYTGLLGSPVGPYIVTMTVIPMDPAGNTMIFIVRVDNSDPTFMSVEPPSGEADHLTDHVANMVGMGSDTCAYAGIAYGTKKVEGQLLPEILCIDVAHGAVTCTEDGKVNWGRILIIHYSSRLVAFA